MLKTAKLHGVGSGTVQRISRELATRTPATGTGKQLFGANLQDSSAVGVSLAWPQSRLRQSNQSNGHEQWISKGISRGH